MKQVKTLADLEAMQPRERDAWFAERFGLGCIPYFTTENNGSAALKAEMVKLGYWWKSEYHDGGYIFSIQHVNDTFKYVIDADTETEATWKAAALALLGE